ncbi:Mediator of RNA polymerase II transcription subunit 11 [Glycine soja]|uniref:Mediator of RNA polymerase II transcription subunit 11 n=1 Tax=Glycine soja TaxID=3848 RepID=A0A445FBN1_GLYSO|nr:Mediator of RNA polymerase II transcription subunit 11 [Glycine soja]
MDSQGQTTSLHRLQNVEKRIVKVLEFAVGVMDELASPIGPRKDVVQNHCLEFMQLIKDISLAVALGSATQIAMFVALAYLLSLPEMKNGGIDPNQKSDSNSRVYIACFNDVLIQLLFSLLNFDQNL